MSAPAVAHPRLAPAGRVLLTATWFALVIGLAEAALLGARHWLFGQFIWSSAHIGWLAPASYVAFFLPPATLVAALAAWRPRLVPTALLVGAGAALATALLARVASQQRLHALAIIVLAAGVGVQAARHVRPRAEAWHRWVRRTVPLLACVVVAVAGATFGCQWWAERRALGRLGPAAAGAPNILFLLLDTVRAANLGLYGYTRPTSPTLDSLGRRGVVFDRAIATAPWTLPSHGSLFTGRDAFELQAGFRRPLAAYPTLAAALAERGYLTAGFAANHWYASWESGLARDFSHYRDYRLTLRQLALSSELGQLISDYSNKLILRTNHAHRAADLNADFLDWLPRDGNRPFFAFLNYFDAHVPYHTPWEFERRFAADSPAVDRYDAAVAYVDDQLGRLLRELERRGVLEHTIVVVVADHGEMLGEHGMDNHGNAVYGRLLHVPLIVAGPGVPAETRVATPVSLRDLPATVLALASPATGDSLAGRSLSRFWNAGQGTAVVGDSVIVSYVERHPTAPSWYRNRDGALWSAISGRWHLIRNADGTLELYDWWSDPAETRDLAGAPAGREPVAQLAPVLDSVRAGAAPHM